MKKPDPRILWRLRNNEVMRGKQKRDAADRKTSARWFLDAMRQKRILPSTGLRGSGKRTLLLRRLLKDSIRPERAQSSQRRLRELAKLIITRNPEKVSKEQWWHGTPWARRGPSIRPKKRTKKKHLMGMGDNINGLRSNVGMGYGSGNASLGSHFGWQEG